MAIKDKLRTHLIRRLREFWQVDPDSLTSNIVPDGMQKHIATVSSDGLPEQVADEILETIDRSPDSFSDFGDDDAPLILKLKANGWMEDDWSARPNDTHPCPVICVHGTGCTNGDFQDLAADLRQAGFTVFAPTYGVRATGPIEESAAQLSGYIDAVLMVTGARKVTVVAHSQGGLVVRYWMQQMNGASKSHHVVFLAVPNHGLTAGGLAAPILKSEHSLEVVKKIAETVVGPVVHQMLIGSDFLERLNAASQPTDVQYTCIATRSDSLVQPPDTCFLDNATNLWVQDLAPQAVVLHRDMPWDKRVRHLVVRALESHP